MYATTRLFDRPETRVLDLLDVALANEMLRVSGHEPLTADVIGPDVVRVTADAEQVARLRALTFDTTPTQMEAWMFALAPRLVPGVLEVVGDDWAAEAEVAVELALALRADDMAGVAEQLEAGGVSVDASRSAAAVIATDVPDPALVYFL